MTSNDKQWVLGYQSGWPEQWHMANYNAVASENVSVRITDLRNVYVKYRYKTCNSHIILKRRKKITSKITKTQWKRLFSLEPNGCSASQ